MCAIFGLDYLFPFITFMKKTVKVLCFFDPNIKLESFCATSNF